MWLTCYKRMFFRFCFFDLKAILETNRSNLKLILSWHDSWIIAESCCHFIGQSEKKKKSVFSKKHRNVVTYPNLALWHGSEVFKKSVTWSYQEREKKAKGQDLKQPKKNRAMYRSWCPFRIWTRLLKRKIEIGFLEQ